jgi:hypothetical protein
MTLHIFERPRSLSRPSRAALLDGFCAIAHILDDAETSVLAVLENV